MPYYTPLEITVVSANDIEYVNRSSKMDVYAKVSITSGSKKYKLKTHVHKGGDTNPEWNYYHKFKLNESTINKLDSLKVEIQLFSKRFFRAIKIGKVTIPANELLQGNSDKNVSYSLVTREGMSKGSVSFKCKLGKKYWVQPPPPVEQPRKKRGSNKLVLGLALGLVLGVGIGGF